MYDEKYVFLGTLQGRFFDGNGAPRSKPTAPLTDWHHRLASLAQVNVVTEATRQFYRCVEAGEAEKKEKLTTIRTLILSAACRQVP